MLPIPFGVQNVLVRDWLHADVISGFKYETERNCLRMTLDGFTLSVWHSKHDIDVQVESFYLE